MSYAKLSPQKKPPKRAAQAEDKPRGLRPTGPHSWKPRKCAVSVKVLMKLFQKFLGVRGQSPRGFNIVLIPRVAEAVLAQGLV